jgi:GalNAc5-diNAcBac-PP-undecaprenol beta-1,3-glucosyltransferase
MCRASVLIPTHEHAATLPFAVASVQAQGIDDIEILIVGDGVNDELRAIVERLRADDARIKFFDFPKGPRNGEMHRDGVVRQAAGRIVCYQTDDDLWLPGHLEDMEAALESADFVGSMTANVMIDGQIWAYFFDQTRPEFREPWLAGKLNGFGTWANDGFGLASTAHRMEAYLRLPEGWTTTPSGTPTDQFMWMKFVRQPWCRIKVLPWPTTARFPAGDRLDWTAQQHVAEKARWLEIMATPAGTQQLYREILRRFGEILLMQIAAARAGAADPETARTLAGIVRSAAFERECEAIRVRAEEREEIRARAEAERAQMLASTSWRVTAPLRAAGEMLRRLGPKTGPKA